MHINKKKAKEKTQQWKQANKRIEVNSMDVIESHEAKNLLETQISLKYTQRDNMNRFLM
jgi:hypothetical protein